ncbi:MAG: monovalent cation:proton antiporter-2 (CPA2) family protein [Hyphomonadaceae bacterium]|nr:monovalent cation:proton antiporter-2 (CPA2) family protein [Hyphomonadaceae bacterium]
MDLGHAVALLAAGVFAVPLFLRLKLGAVLGYLAAGVIVGPYALGLFNDSEAILAVAELGVVMFLFLIGLEMRPAKLWAMRKDIFGLGLAQVLLCTALLTGVSLAFNIPLAAAFIGAAGFVLSSTAVIMKMLDDRGETSSPPGQRSVAILLLEDLMIIPLLAIVPVLAALSGHIDPNARPIWQSIGIGAAAVAVVFVAGKWVMNPFIGALARYGAREIMTAAALLVVLGAALFMQWGGLSMGMGAFLAGVLLSESTFRHQLEADVEPFRGILLGLFFLGVGMSLDLMLVANNWQLIAAGVAAFMVVKAGGIYAVARLFKAKHREALHRASLFAQGGEFAFVLYAGARSAGVMDAETAAGMTAVVILSMALTPLVVMGIERLTPPEKESLDGIEEASDLHGQVLFVGFGRFAQVVSQPLLAKGIDISIIETDVEMIRAAGNFGFKVYYGDGTRLDVLRASGAANAEAILVCVEKPEVADRIVELVKSEFPHPKLFVRAFDRGHVLRLISAGVDYQIRETFESALVFGRQVLVDLGIEESEADEAILDTRRRDEQRLEMQIAGGLRQGLSLMRGNIATTQPAPLVVPREKAKALNEEAAEAIGEKQHSAD